MAKQLKKWNGSSGRTKYGHANIAAYTQKDAIELLKKVDGFSMMNLTHFRGYYSPCWGNDMNGIEPTEPCVYIVKNYGTPQKVI